MSVPVPEQFWPVSITGWASLVLSVGTAIGFAIAYGKWLEKLNGLGARTKVLEDYKAHTEGQEVERARVMERILNQHEGLIERIGEAKRSADDCHAQSADQTLQIGSQISEVNRTVNDMRLDLAQRLTAVETALRLRKES